MYNVLYSTMSKTHTERSDMDHTVYLQITPCLPFVSQVFTRWHHDKLRWKSSDWRLLLIYRPGRDERLSWPCCLTYSGWVTHISGYPSATGRAQDGSSPAERPTFCHCSCTAYPEQVSEGRKLRGTDWPRFAWEFIVVVVVEVVDRLQYE